MIKAVIFDCFGVIIKDTSFRQMLADVGEKDPVLRDQIIDIVDQSCEGSITTEESRQKIAALLEMDPDDWQRQLTTGEIKDPLMLKRIQSLRPVYKTAIVSNVGRGGLHSRFTQQELGELFDVVVASGDIGAAKPEPEIFEYALQQLGVSAQESVFVDDFELYVEAAGRLGIKTIHYQDFEQFSAELDHMLAANSKD